MRRNLLALVLILGLLAGLGCTPTTPAPAIPTVVPPAAVTPTPAGPSAPALETITILHTNDFHGALAPEVVKIGSVSFESGGLANLVGHIDQFRKDAGGKVLLLDAGDIWQGTFASNQTKGATVIDAYNIAGYDAAALGNHDLDFGQDVLRQRVAQARFPFLAANTVEESSGKIPAYLKPYIIKQVGALKVGVIGIANPGTAAIVKAESVKGLKFLDGVETVSALLPDLRPQVDILVVLSHMGFQADQELAARVKGVDVIVGGHTHTEQRYTMRVNDTLVVQAGTGGKVLGRLELTFDRASKKIVKYTTANELVNVVSTTYPPNAQVAALVNARLDEAKAIMDKPLGETKVDLDPCTEGECPLGNLVADAMLAAPAGDRPADASMHNNSGLRARIPAGPITYGQLYQVLPFDNTIATMELTGEQIWAILERTVSGRRGNLVVAGMTYRFDYSKPAGNRLLEVTIGGKPLDVKRTYRINTIDYLATGGDGQTTFTQGKIITYGDPVVDVVAQYIKNNSPVNPKAENRIVPH
jgi:2',3'-cyclic-nucleotide 2'-phosphodiesterase (5'-nucleotidase family)